ncbi:MAG TPA: Uma2 family endonuclease [Planctomycetota bacterium]|nr:Uma2 family endonuclease [Planctomycetota bacterium]
MGAALKLHSPRVELKTVDVRRNGLHLRNGAPNELPRRLFTVEEYHRMGDAGILSQEERVELLDGEIFIMSPIGPMHSGHVDRVQNHFVRQLGDDAIVSGQNPVVTDKVSEPQPDIAILRPRADFYTTSHPMPRDILLIIEVSDSTLIRDRKKKLLIYARNGIREYWIINLLEGTLEVYRVPKKNGYLVKKVLTREDSIAPLAFPNKKIAVKDLILPATE